jgi:hypothetical protein
MTMEEDSVAVMSSEDRTLSTFESASCLASLARWDEYEDTFKEAALSLIRRLASEGTSPGYLNGQAVANCFSALAKWHTEAICKEASRMLAGRITVDEAIVRQLNGVRLAICISALSRWSEDDICRIAGVRLAKRISEDGNLWAQSERAVSRGLPAERQRTVLIRVKCACDGENRVLRGLARRALLFPCANLTKFTTAICDCADRGTLGLTFSTFSDQNR